MEENSLHIVIVGHVDHGKSTLIGRLFYDTGSLPPDKLEEIRRISASQGRDTEFAYVMDHLEEERNKGITIDIAHTFFTTDRRRYVIIDAPGHKEFIKNMISGTSQAEAALLLVDISQGIREQTRRHCYILSMLGVRQVAVVVNKMDMVGYDRQRFEALATEITALLEGLGVTPSYVIPISAKLGDNVAARCERLDWFDGPTVLEALDSFEALKVEEKGLRFPVQDIYDLDGVAVAVGRVEAGRIEKGRKAIVLPDNREVTILEVKKFGEDDMACAGAGECVGLRIEGEGLRRGHVLVDKPTATVTDTIEANIFWMVEKDYEMGVPVTWKCATQEARGTIRKISKRFDPASIEIIEKDASRIKPAEVAEVEIRLDHPVVIDRFADIPEMGRFVLEHRGYPVAGGIII